MNRSIRARLSSGPEGMGFDVSRTSACSRFSLADSASSARDSSMVQKSADATQIRSILPVRIICPISLLSREKWSVGISLLSASSQMSSRSPRSAFRSCKSHPFGLKRYRTGPGRYESFPRCGLIATTTSGEARYMQASPSWHRAVHRDLVAHGNVPRDRARSRNLPWHLFAPTAKRVYAM